MSDYTNNYKAGDFTSGKMGDIFKSVFMDSRTTVINHKQFGECYVIPKSDMKDMTNFILGSLLGFRLNEESGLLTLSNESDIPTLEQMKDIPYTEFLKTLVECNAEGVNNEFDWFTVLGKTIDLAYCYDIGENPEEYIAEIKKVGENDK